MNVNQLTNALEGEAGSTKIHLAFWVEIQDQDGSIRTVHITTNADDICMSLTKPLLYISCPTIRIGRSEGKQ